VASNDDAYSGAPDGFSALTQAIHSNITYYIAVDGFDGASGVAYLGYIFTPGPLFTLTIGSAGNGQVTPPWGDVVSNSTVVVNATPDPFFEFANWTGSFLATANPLSFVVNSNIQLTANFRPISFTDDFETGNLWHGFWQQGLLNGASDFQVVFKVLHFAACFGFAKRAFHLMANLTGNQCSGKRGDKNRNDIGRHNLLRSKERGIGQDPAWAPAVKHRCGKVGYRGDKSAENADRGFQPKRGQDNQEKVEQKGWVDERTIFGSEPGTGHKSNQDGGKTSL